MLRISFSVYSEPKIRARTYIEYEYVLSKIPEEVRVTKDYEQSPQIIKVIFSDRNYPHLILLIKENTLTKDNLWWEGVNSQQ